MLKNLLDGFTSLGNASSIAYLISGALVGMFIGVVPGLSGVVVLSLILAFIKHISLTGTLCLFLGTQAGSYFSASISSILLNMPAHPEAFAVSLDGYPMAQKGQAGRALGLSAMSTCIGGVIGSLVLIGFVQLLNRIPRLFTPPEYVALIVVALVLVAALGTDSALKAIASVGLGLMISSIGPSDITGTFRYTFGSVGLYGGVALVSMALGIFAIPQMVLLFGTGTAVASQDLTGRELEAKGPIHLETGFGTQVIAGVVQSLRHWFLALRSGVIGALLGIVPGIGGFAANFITYGLAKQTSRRRDEFGTGIDEGVIAPEASSLAKEAGSMVPILALGIPGSVGGALFLVALQIKGIRTGYGFATTYPTLPYQIVWVILLAGIIGTAAGVVAAPFLARITKVPGTVLLPFIFVLAIVGPFASTVSFFEVLEVLVFAVIGIALRRLRYSLASFVLGLVLGPTLETNIYLTHQVFHGKSFLWRSPIADLLMVVAIGILVVKILQGRRLARQQLAQSVTGNRDGSQSMDSLERSESAKTPYPLLGLITTTVLLGITIPWLAIGFGFDFTTGALPDIAGILVGIAMAFSLPKDIAAYLSYRRVSRSSVVPMARVGAQTAVLHVAKGVTESNDVNIEPPLAGLSTSATLGVLPRIFDFSQEIELRAWGPSGQYMRELFAFLWLGALTAACYLFGFEWPVVVFCLLYGVTCTKRFMPSLARRLVFSAITALVMWAVTFEVFRLLSLVFTPVFKW